MDEAVFFTSNHADATGNIQSVHSQQYAWALRQAQAHCAAVSGLNVGDRIFIPAANKALINVYSVGKDAVEQRIPVPEALCAVAVVPNPTITDTSLVNCGGLPREQLQRLSEFNLPYLLVGGSESGKVYTWELNSGFLLSVKSGHYQGVTKIKSCGNMVYTSGKDGRLAIWKLNDLISEEGKPVKYLHDHSLEILDFVASKDRLMTLSRDNTIRIYNDKLLLTLAVQDSIVSLVADPAERVLYVGTTDGGIIQIPMYYTNPVSGNLESIYNGSSITTVVTSSTLTPKEMYRMGQILCNKHNHHSAEVTCMVLSLDASLLFSGDAAGEVIGIDAYTGQVLKKLRNLPGSINSLFIAPITSTPADVLEAKRRALPNFKRNLVSKDDLNTHEVVVQHAAIGNNDVYLGDDRKLTLDIDTYLNTVASQEMFFATSGAAVPVDVAATSNSSEVDDLKAQVEKTTAAYKELRAMYDELYESTQK